MAETVTGRVALITGAASPLGAALLKQIPFNRYRHVVLAESAAKQYMVRALVKRIGTPMSRMSIIPIDPRKPFAGLELTKPPFDEAAEVDLFNLDLCRDRGTAASEIRAHNELVVERMIAIAHKLPSVHALVMVTDIGLVGDYPGRFSENWIDVGQTPFDEVDRSSMAAELTALKERSLPLIRARVGLVLDPVGIPAALGYWRPVSETFVGFSSIIKRLPRMITIPVATAKGALIPITPADFAASVLLEAVSRSDIVESALHIVMEPPPTADAVFAMSARRIGGAGLKSGLPIDKVAKLGFIPGFKELARRNADQLAAWWTPHRYCLSRNDVDTSHLRRLLPQSLTFPKWHTLEPLI